jgi:DNA-binding FadR family transcriptional regulator
MSAVNGSIGATHLAQQLGPWRGADGTVRGNARGKSLQAALAERITALVLDGRIAVGVRLPAERTLSDAAGVSRTTVTAAYALLRESGFAD